MVGKYSIELVTKRMRFLLEVKRKYTIIRGDSGTGKSTFVNYIMGYQLHGESSGVILKCDIPIKRVLNSEDFKKFKECILVIDEGDIVLREENIATLFKESDNYFIILSREKLGYLPYSDKDIYEIKSDRVQNKFYESRFVNRYQDIIQKGLPELKSDVLSTDEEL